ncbi:MAG: hypothetical protein M0033_07955 [Nitrospiraceae bacterium]|nr:hypothetical protein [Nitrospiraceae bacterium]MDA8326138.1 hypothetical protein [Nitrospiraceae bacterium]
MTEILPEGEQLRRAVRWISTRRDEEPRKNLLKLIEEACLQFDLSPKDCDFLVHFFTQEGK